VRLHRFIAPVYRAYLDADAWRMGAKVAARSRCRSRPSRPSRSTPSAANTWNFVLHERIPTSLTSPT